MTAVTAFLKAGTDPNQQDEFGKTPLHYAAVSDATVEEVLPLIEALLEGGADPDVEDWEYGWTPVQAADNSDNWSIEDSQKIVKALLEEPELRKS